MFFSLYYTMTGLHGLHMVIGIALLVLTGLGQYFSTRWPKDEDLTESLGLYWHFVDIVWIFLFPLFYLVQRV